MNLGLERDLDIKVEVQPESEGIALAPFFLLLNGVTGDAAKCTRRRVDETAGCVLDIVESEVVEGTLTALRPLVALLPGLPLGLVVLRLALRLVRLLLAGRLLPLRAASGRHRSRLYVLV